MEGVLAVPAPCWPHYTGQAHWSNSLSPSITANEPRPLLHSLGHLMPVPGVRQRILSPVCYVGHHEIHESSLDPRQAQAMASLVGALDKDKHEEKFDLPLKVKPSATPSHRPDNWRCRRQGRPKTGESGSANTRNPMVPNQQKSLPGH